MKNLGLEWWEFERVCELWWGWEWGRRCRGLLGRSRGRVGWFRSVGIGSIWVEPGLGLEHLPVCHAHGFAERCPVSLPSSRSSSRRHHQLAVCCPLPTNTDLSSSSIFFFVAVDNRGSSVVLSASSSSPCCAPPPQLSSAFAVVVAELAVSPPRQSSNRRRPSFVSPSHRSSSSSVVLRSSVASLGSIYRRHVKPGRRRSRSKDPTRTNNGDF